MINILHTTIDGNISSINIHPLERNYAHLKYPLKFVYNYILQNAEIAHEACAITLVGRAQNGRNNRK